MLLQLLVVLQLALVVGELELVALLLRLVAGQLGVGDRLPRLVLLEDAQVGALPHLVAVRRRLVAVEDGLVATQGHLVVGEEVLVLEHRRRVLLDAQGGLGLDVLELGLRGVEVVPRGRHRVAAHRVVEGRLVLGEPRLRLAERVLERGRIDAGEHLPGGDVVADVDVDLDELPGLAEARVLLVDGDERPGRPCHHPHRAPAHQHGRHPGRRGRARVEQVDGHQQHQPQRGEGEQDDTDPAGSHRRPIAEIAATVTETRSRHASPRTSADLPFPPLPPAHCGTWRAPRHVGRNRILRGVASLGDLERGLQLTLLMSYESVRAVRKRRGR